VNKQDFKEYNGRLCRIITEKTWKHQSNYQCVSETVEIANDQHVYVTDTKGSCLEIQINTIYGVHENEEQF
jgi:hypothetical protein